MGTISGQFSKADIQRAHKYTHITYYSEMKTSTTSYMWEWTTSAKQGMKRKKLFYTVSGTANWHEPQEKQFGEYLKKYKNTLWPSNTTFEHI